MAQARVAQEGTGREAERRRTILRAAVEVFAKKGYHGCRIADVAREAKVAYGLVYHYFKNKDELLASVFDSAWSMFMGALEAAFTKEGTLEERIRAVAHVTFHAYREDPRAVRVVITEVARSPAGKKLGRAEAFGQVIALAEQMFVEAKARGELSSKVEPKIAAVLLFGALEMGLTAFVSGLFDVEDPTALERAQGQFADVLVGGLLAARPHEHKSKGEGEKTDAAVQGQGDHHLRAHRRARQA